VTIARSLTDSFSGIRPADVPGFIAMQVVGAAAAPALFTWLVPPTEATESNTAVAHESESPS